jgi:hypothetical protein
MDKIFFFCPFKDNRRSDLIFTIEKPIGVLATYWTGVAVRPV